VEAISAGRGKVVVSTGVGLRAPDKAVAPRPVRPRKTAGKAL
jgi:hypothetical protein